MSTTRHLVFIDSRVTDYQTLLGGLPEDSVWFVLDAGQDGVAQMQATLAHYINLDAIHILSHGSVGTLYLGSTILNQDTLSSYRSQLASIGQSLTDSGDLLLYGCNVGQGQEGLQFVNNLAQLTGADVAASEDVSGVTGRGGDGVLEFHRGAIESIAIDVARYEGTLAVINGTDGNDTLEGTTDDDTLLGGSGSDQITGSGGADYIEGGDEINEWSGDNLQGGPGHDTLLGGAGRDYLYGNTGNDRLDGGAGNDYLVSNSGEGNDTLLGGDGNDELVVWSYHGVAESITLNASHCTHRHKL